MVAPRTVFTLVLLMAAGLSRSAAQPATGVAPLSVDDIVKLTKEGISEDVLAAKIKKNGRAFDLSPDELVELKRLGVTDNVIKLLLDPTQPYVPPPPPPPPAPQPAPLAPKPVVPGKKYPEDPYASRIPPEPGLYRIQRNAPVAIDIKLFMGQKQGAGLGKVLMKKGKAMAYLAGSAAKAQLQDAAPVFYMRMADGKGIEEVVLVALDRKKDRRELDMGPPAPKPELKADTIRPFDSLEVGTGLFRLTPATLVKGEYMFFLIGTAEPPKGNYGKGFDFGMQPPAVEKKR
jgi:hypothetical protein